MATQFVRTKLFVNPEQLQNEINNNATFVATLLDIMFEQPDQLTLTFSTDLTGEETSMMDTLVSNHVPSTIEISSARLPVSDLDKHKISVHTSYKPMIPGVSTYATWTGAGDDVPNSPDGHGDGDLLEFDMTPGVPSVTKEAHFDPVHGRVWIHEGYMKFENGGPGDYMHADVTAPATPLQQAANLDYNVTDNWVTYAGPGAGTHGLAGTPVLIPRTYSKDGDWDYDGVDLTPNLTQTGGYKISDIERSVHRYINKIPCRGNTAFFSMTSDETAELKYPYFLKITFFNVSDTAWYGNVFMELYRERTHTP